MGGWLRSRCLVGKPVSNGLMIRNLLPLSLTSLGGLSGMGLITVGKVCVADCCSGGGGGRCNEIYSLLSKRC